MFPTPNNPMCEHKFSINICFKCKCRLADLIFFRGELEGRNDMSDSSMNKIHQCQSADASVTWRWERFPLSEPAREATHSQITALFMWEMHTGLLVVNYTLIFHLYWMGHWAFSQLGVQDWKKWWIIACRHVFFFVINDCHLYDNVSQTFLLNIQS